MPIDVTRLLAETCLCQCEWLSEVDSTNDRALNLASDPGIALPALVGADQQTAGRGRGSNRWWGGHGALMFSLVIDMPNVGLSMNEWPRFSLVTGLAISETVRMFVPTAQVGLKWPNDVWIDGRKVCGILIEQAERLPNRLVIGIGINVNNSFGEAPKDQRQIATSMIDVAQGSPFSRTEILIDFLNRWRVLVHQLAQSEIGLAERWSQACVLSGHAVTITSGNNETTGICAGIDEDGSLLLRTAFALERCYAGTVRLLSAE